MSSASARLVQHVATALHVDTFDLDFYVKVLCPLVVLLLIPCCAGVVYHYAAPYPQSTWPVRLLAFCTLGLGFSGILLLPLDLTLSSNNDNTVNATYLPWLITYWCSFLLAFVVLPITRKSLQSGYFSWRARLWDSIRSSVRTWLILFVVLLVCMIFLAIKTHTSVINVLPLLMAIGNTYGLLLVALLLGYGLVDVPRRLWRHGSAAQELRKCHILANAADEALFEAVWQLQDLEEEIDSVLEPVIATRSNMVNDLIYQDCLHQLLARRNAAEFVHNAELLSRRASKQASSQKTALMLADSSEGLVLDQNFPSTAQLATLHKRLKSSHANLRQAQQAWHDLVQTSRHYQAIVSGDQSYFTSKFQFKWYTFWLQPCTRLLAICAATMSLLVLWCETTVALPYNTSPFALILKLLSAHLLGFCLVALIPLLYMSVCVYSSLFKISFFGPYSLRANRQSSGVALIFSSQYLVRMQFPLGYNYLVMLKYDSSASSFFAIMQNMATVPFFGTSFNVYAPLLILTLCGFTLCNGYSKLLHLLGLEHEDAILQSADVESKVREGQVLLRRHEERSAASTALTSTHNSTSTRLVEPPARIKQFKVSCSNEDETKALSPKSRALEVSSTSDDDVSPRYKWWNPLV